MPLPTVLSCQPLSVFKKNTPFIMCVHVMCMYGHRCPRVLGGQTTTWWSRFSCSTFLWVPEIELGFPGLCGKGLYPLNYLYGLPVLPNSLLFSFKVWDPAQGLIHEEEVLHYWTISLSQFSLLEPEEGSKSQKLQVSESGSLACKLSAFKTIVCQ